MLYITLGFRQFSHHFTGLRDALDAGEENRARELLAQWQQVDASELPRTELVRHVIEFSVLAAHRHVFGVLAWYSMLAALGLGKPSRSLGAVVWLVLKGRAWWLRRFNPWEVASFQDSPLALHYASYPRGYQPFRLGPEKIIRLLERQAA